MKLGKSFPILYKDERIKKKFAFFPKVLTNYDSIWFESYFSYDIYRPSGIAWAGNNWKPDEKWVEEYSASTKKEVVAFLKKQYKIEKQNKKNSQDFFKYLKGIK